MQPIMWHKRRLLMIAIMSAVAYITLRVKWYSYASEDSIRNANAQTVWEFVADFSNMRYLQPHLTNFTILAESGNYDHWRYSVEYYEPLSKWPYTDTVGVGHYSVKKVDDKYVVSSNHETCFIGTWGCLKTEHEIIIRPIHNGQDAYFKETIKYQCPVLLSLMCYAEVDLTRNLYKKNLIKQFS